MGLKEYRRKRNFSRTSEPPGSKSNTEGNSYIIQKHAARRLHYDLRLELDGVLVSWAIPKGPSLDPKERRLAVHVEDHPVEYGDFEGNIPKGEYGGGTVLLWDRGTWEPEGDPHEGIRRGDLKFTLHGEKLRGSWVLVRMGKAAGSEDEKENWLLIKHSDIEAASLKERDILNDRPESAASGRNMEQIASDYDREWTSKGETPRNELPATAAKKQSAPMKSKPKIETAIRSLSGAQKALLPESIYPQLATLALKVPEGDQWIHEIKFDGYRALCKIYHGKASFYTRGGNDWTQQFGQLPAKAAEIPVESALLDGEVVVLLPDGSTSFQALQNALRKETEQLIFYVFDLLYLNGYDLRRTPLIQRKEMLASLIQENDGAILLSNHYQGSGNDLFNSACQYKLEGIISKRIDCPYTSGRTTDWIKIKCLNNQEFVIGGYTDPAGSRIGFGALLVGLYENGNLIYCGKVGTGYSDRIFKEIYPRLERLQQVESPFFNPPRGAARRNAHWIKPDLVAQVSFSGWTKDKILRHPSFQGLREDKPAADVHRETPSEIAVQRGNTNQYSGVKITNPDRILYPEQGITKSELAQYYESIAVWALPQIQNRPLMLLRCPEGSDKECFHQKHASISVPSSVKKIPIMENGKEKTGLAIDSATGLISLAQMGSLEIHSWGCLIEQMEQPDLMVLDLDPDPAVAWKSVVEAAFQIRLFLQSLGLISFIKTTGGKGLHLTVPLSQRNGWDQVKEFSKQIAELLARAYPDRYISKMTKAKRTGKIYIDYLRNGRGATFICPYSTRAKTGAPVAAPIHWDELSPELKPNQFTIRNMPQRLARLHQDPWEGINKIKQSITAAMQKKL
jgi:bifunctional non-homologous end joining protein LigD